MTLLAAAEPAVRTRGPARAHLMALRPRQWMKNGLVIGAPLAAGRLFEPRVLLVTAAAFVALCLASSAAYLVNDVHDRVEDRDHPVKRFRPVAAGDVRVPVALAAAGLLALTGLGVGIAVSAGFALLLAGYLATTVSYSLWLRREPVVELVVVAAGFLIRGAAGGVAAGIPVSSWFLLVAGFGSLFLVSGKRYAELVSRAPRPGSRASLLAYSPAYLRFVWATAATLSVITYALWAHDVYAVRDDGSWAMWSVLPFLVAILRYALDVDRAVAEAPEELVLRDRTLQVLGLVWLVMMAVGAGGLGAGP